MKFLEDRLDVLFFSLMGIGFIYMQFIHKNKEGFKQPIANLTKAYPSANNLNQINYYPKKISSFVPLNEPQVRQFNRSGLVSKLRNEPNINWTIDTYIPANAEPSWKFNTNSLPRTGYPFQTEILSPNSLK